MRKIIVPLVIILVVACGQIRFSIPGRGVSGDDKLNGIESSPSPLPTDDKGGKLGTPTPTPTPSAGGSTLPVENAAATFTVLAGAGRNAAPLNTAQTVITVKVGEKIRFVNNGADDFVLHCDGGGPMPHWSSNDTGATSNNCKDANNVLYQYPRLKPGETKDFVACAAYDMANSNADCYRHTGNTTTLFFLKVNP